MNQKLLIVAHTNLGTSLSGGDQIFLNLIKSWSSHFDITFLASTEAQTLYRNFSSQKIKFIKTAPTSPIKHLSTLNIFYHHLIRFISGLTFSLTHLSLYKNSDVIYTSSDFYGDFIFGLIAKLVNPNIRWICGYYLFAPSPFDLKSPYYTTKKPLRGLIYFLAQLPTRFLANYFADIIFVTSEPDQKLFSNKPSFIIQGGVDIPTSHQISSLPPVSHRPYDAIFIGRLHSQKGILEFIDIWYLVTKTLPKAQLIIIGDGELENAIKHQIKKLKLSSNIKMVGFKNGPEKYEYIKSSKMVVHPATYDSGGMAAAEALAFGLPGVSYDLPALKTYYPQGMIKSKCFDQLEFSQNIITLLTNPSIYSKYSKQAISLTKENWSWQKRFENIYTKLYPISF